MMSYIEVRCPGHRPHLIGGQLNINCDYLLAGINTENVNDFVVKCKVCKSMFNIKTTEEGCITMEEIDVELKRGAKCQVKAENL
jgi:peptide deformylase